MLFKPRNGLLYVEGAPFGVRGTGFQGESFYSADNPPYGVALTYYLKDGYKTLKQTRLDAEKEDAKKKITPPYPTHEQLVAEGDEEAPSIILTVTDASGRLVRRLTGPVSKGVQRITWDLRAAAPSLSEARGVPAMTTMMTDLPVATSCCREHTPLPWRSACEE